MKTLLYASLLSICLCAYTNGDVYSRLDKTTLSSAAVLDADLSLTKSTIAELGTKYGTNVPFNITITNNSIYDVREIVIEDLIPEGYEFNTTNNPLWSYDNNTRIATYTHSPVIGAGDSHIITLNLILGPSTVVNGWLNRAEIISAIGEDDEFINDPDPDNDKDSLAVEVLDLALRKVQVTTPDYVWDQEMDFIITVFNQGNTTANFIEVIDYKPEGYFFDGSLNIGNGWFQVVDTIKNVIPTLAPGASIDLPLTLILQQDMFDGFAWDNYAEIVAMRDYNNLSANAKDADSTPRSNSTYENSVRPGDPFDDEILGNGQGSGPNGEDEDEDDHDVAGPEIFDLAIRKERVSSPPSYSYVQQVEFEVIVFNQGNILGENIVVAEYIPCGFELAPDADPLWDFDSGTRIATYDIPATIPPNETYEISVKLDVNPCFIDQANAWTNGCEIYMANNGRRDIDSEPDNINGNDNGGIAKSASDNEIDGDSRKGEDEDDHDVELAEVYDLAVKVVIVENPPYDYGQELTFRTKVFNQGNVIAENILIRNNLPAGYEYLGVNNTTTYNPNPWNDSDPLKPTIFIDGPLLQGDSTFVDLKLRVIDAGATAKDWYVYGTIQVSQDTVGVNRFDDADSLPSTDFDGETSVAPGDPEDDDIFFNSTLGFFQDQDDYDVAGFNVLDLALIKTANLPGPFYPGDKVPFKIKVFNQGSLVADNILIGDTIPEGFIFDGGDGQNGLWSYNAGNRVATRIIPGPLGLEEMDSVEITLTIASITGGGDDWTNISEIQAAREEGSQVGGIDFDSPMDTNFSNDVGGTPDSQEDNHVDDNGSDFNMDGITDEDNHDPARVQVIDITHEKIITSSSINPDGTFNVVYEIVVNNYGNAEGHYTLQDQPSYDDDINIISATYSSNTPNGGSLPTSGLWTLATSQMIPAGGTHNYTVTVVVNIDLSDSAGDDTYTMCGNGGQQPGQEGEGLFNKSLLDADDDGDVDEESTACGDLPYIIMKKDIVTTTLNGNGTYDVTYAVEVSNIGGRDGMYTLTDTPQFDDDIIINSGSFSGTQSGAMNLSGTTTLANSSSIGIDEVHIYLITFNVTLDLEPDGNDPGDNLYTPCSNPGNDPGSNPGEGLYNKSELDRGSNGTIDIVDDACGDLPYLTMFKNFVSASPLPNGHYTVVYEINIENTGGSPDTYELTDTPSFDDDIVINSGSFSGQNSGAMNTSGSTTLADAEVINVGETHTYTITLDVSIDLEPGSTDGGDNIYTPCEVPGSEPGSSPGEGLYNLAELDSGDNGSIDIRDDACGDLPYVVVDKTFISTTPLLDGTYDVEYRIDVRNYGGAQGNYRLTDTPVFDDDIVINSGSFSGQNVGTMNSAGSTQLADNELIDAGGLHTYNISLNVSIDLGPGSTDGGDNVYNACSSPQNEPGSNPGEGLYNLAQLDRGSNGTNDTEDDTCADLPYITMTKDFLEVEPQLPDGSYNVVYRINVNNIGGAAGDYTLEDEPQFDDDVVINYGSYSGQNSGSMNTSGPTQLAINENISVGASHSYFITLNVTLDLSTDSNDGGDNIYNACSIPGNGPGSNPGEGLYNLARLDRGGDGSFEIEDDACGDLPFVDMEKDFVSATQLTDGSYDVRYQISITNAGGVAGIYTLTDTPLFDDDIIINNGNFSGQNSGPMNTNGSTTLAVGESIDPGSTHTYDIILNVTIDLETNDNDQGNNQYSSCSNPGNDPGSNPGEGLYNLAQLDRGSNGRIDVEDDACGDLPYVVIDKVFLGSNQLIDGNYEVSYRITVENIGGIEGDYRLSDTPQFDDDIVINNGSYSGQRSGSMNTSGTTVLTSNEMIGVGIIHTYDITLNVTIDLDPGSTDGGDNIYTECSSPENEPGSNPGEGLYNKAELDRGSNGNNDVEDDTCGDLPYIVMSKDFVDAVQQPDGSYNVTFNIDVTNIGGALGFYTLSDTPMFDDDVTINGGGFTLGLACCGAFAGNFVGNPSPLTLVTNSPIDPGFTDVFSITYNVIIDLEPGSPDGGDNIYTSCSNPGNDPGSNPGEGLYNLAQLDRGDNGNVDVEDDACGDLPYVVMDKSFISAIEQPDGSFEVIYEIVVQNIGGAEGNYALTDTPQFDDDITINNGSYSGQNNGPMNTIGPTTLAINEIIQAGGTHNYTIMLNVTLDLSEGGNDPGDNEYDPCSNPQNEPGSNPGEGLYNIAELDRGSDGNNDVEDDTCGDLEVTIGDFVWNDLDGDGIQDAGEPGIEDITVILYTCDGQFVESTQTNSQGIYQFENILPGCYYFEVSQPEGFEISPADEGGDDALDSDLTEDNGPLTSSDFAIDRSGNIYDFAFIGVCIGLGGEIWYDLNMDDMKNNGENGINGITVLLWKRINGSWEFQEETFTGPVPNTPSDDGYYKFCVLPGEYHIQFFMPPNSLVTVRPNIGPDETIDSDVTDLYGLGTTDSYFVARDVDTTFFCDIGAGYYPMGTAGDHVWIDVDGNGLRESLEPAAEGILVEAFNINDQKVAETNSDEYGRYRLEYLKKDAHYLRFTPPDGFGFTWSDPSNTLEDDIDSDVDHSNGPNTTQFYMIQPDSHTGHIDAGLSYAALPVEWLSFTGKNIGNANLLEWSTTSEVNTLKYEIMRKSPSDIGFHVVGEVEAAGFSTNTRSYDFTDDDLRIEGAYYYKLRQVDQNGDFSFSEVVKVDVNPGSSAAIEVYPNPAINHINIQGINQLDNIEMYDMTGSLISSWNTDEVNSIRLNLSKTIPTGNYIFKLVRKSGESIEHHIMILNNR